MWHKKFVGFVSSIVKKIAKKENKMIHTSVGSDDLSGKTYWENNPTAACGSATWVSNNTIAEAVYRRMSGGVSNKHWLNWLLEDYFNGRKFGGLLSPGCGIGGHEIVAAKSGIFEYIDAFDYSSSSIKIARESAQSMGLSINFYQDDFNKFTIDSKKKYSMVLCSGSLHHVRELERFLSIVHNGLSPEGYFVVNEYVGDCHNIYSEKQLSILNRIYNCISEELKISQIAKITNPTIDQVLAVDPSESVRSKLIPSFINYYFDIEFCHPFGGFIMHPLYSYLKNDDLSSNDPKIKTILRLLIEFENILMEMPGGLETDFCLYLLKPKKIGAN